MEDVGQPPPERDPLEHEQEERAADQARRIGGRNPQPDVDPEDRAVVEGGGGEAEGFEQAESELVERAEHGEGGYSGSESFEGEPDQEDFGAAYGEPDEIDPTEVTRDPEERGEDPGEGPGLSAER